jgi:hypothetical protein
MSLGRPKLEPIRCSAQEQLSLQSSQIGVQCTLLKLRSLFSTKPAHDIQDHHLRTEVLPLKTET